VDRSLTVVAVASDRGPVVGSGPSDVALFVVDAGKDGVSGAASEDEASELMAVLEGVALPTPYDEQVTVVTGRSPTLEVGVQVETNDGDADRSDCGLEQLVGELDCFELSRQRLGQRCFHRTMAGYLPGGKSTINQGANTCVVLFQSLLYAHYRFPSSR
jgi:hypothetical protein